jgi:hypothetical protein
MEKIKRSRVLAAITMAAATAFAGAAKAADYVSIVQSVDVNKPAEAVWKKVGGFCSIHDWLGGVSCSYASGTGDLGTDRLIAGRIHEIMVARTDLSYTYAQPLSPIEYHGSVEVKPVTPTTSKIVYTIFYDAGTLPDQAAKDADRAHRATMFMGALTKMKALAEAD